MEKGFYAEYFEVEDRHWWFLGRRRVLLRVLERCLPDASGTRRLLDFGCGTGAMIEHLARYGQAEGVDRDEDAVRFCRERGLDRVRQVPQDTVPLESGSYDVITALDVLEHIEDDLGTVRELTRLLRPGGMLLVTVPAYRFLWGNQDEVSHHKRRYVASELHRLLTAADLQVQRLSYFNALLFPIIAAIRLLRRGRGGTSEVKSDFTLTRSGRLNRVLARTFGAEAPLVERLDLPFGVSILAVARKQAPAN
jgi:2-polyprenyl-3-methyl-5-hydroxy-6-metoxy-1,4-benzoquinol methylase